MRITSHPRNSSTSVRNILNLNFFRDLQILREPSESPTLRGSEPSGPTKEKGPNLETIFVRHFWGHVSCEQASANLRYPSVSKEYGTLQLGLQTAPFPRVDVLYSLFVRTLWNELIMSTEDGKSLCFALGRHEAGSVNLRVCEGCQGLDVWRVLCMGDSFAFFPWSALESARTHIHLRAYTSMRKR